MNMVCRVSDLPRESHPRSEAAGIAAAREITRRASATFYFSLSFLGRRQRRAIWTIYAFCRTTDDIVDTLAPAAERLATLERWTADVEDALRGNARSDVLYAFAETMHRYAVDPRHARDLIAGARRDISISRYATYAELLEYCDLVASTVGLLTLPILGSHAPAARLHAISLGRAMQMTNILRDVGADALLGRVYLPQDDLAAFGCDERDIFARRRTEAFATYLRFEIARTRELYAAARPGIAMLEPRSRPTVRVASRLYEAILDRIVANAYDPLTSRAFVPRRAKIGLALRAILA